MKKRYVYRANSTFAITSRLVPGLLALPNGWYVYRIQVHMLICKISSSQMTNEKHSVHQLTQVELLVSCSVLSRALADYDAIKIEEA